MLQFLYFSKGDKNEKNKLLSLLLTGSAVILAACSSGESSDAGGDTLVVANGADPVTLDIQDTNDMATTRVATQIYETLIFQDNDLELQPGLATEWEEVDEDL